MEPKTKNSVRFISLTLARDRLEFPLLRKAVPFSMEERRKFNLLGLLPEVVETIEEQAKRHRSSIRDSKPKSTNIYLRNIQDTNETLFYRLVNNHLDEMMPVIYFPTVGAAVAVSKNLPPFTRRVYLLTRTGTVWTIFCKTCRTMILK